jgi:purine-nucleoside phosphorylase
MTTPHINAKKSDFAKTVLMPGDPKRAKFIAEIFLKDHKQVTDIRGMLGFTGFYKGKKISVMGSGMVCLQLAFIHENYSTIMKLTTSSALGHVVACKKISTYMTS